MKSKTIKVKVINKWYEVNFVPLDDNCLGTGNWGIIYYDPLTIYIGSDLSEHSKRESLTHELVHAYWNEIGNHQAVPTQEVMCDFFSIWGAIIIKQVTEILEKYEKEVNKK